MPHDTLQATGEWYKGDFATKMKFYFDTNTRKFSFFDAENLVYMDQPCYPCTTMSDLTWRDQVSYQYIRHSLGYNLLWMA